MNGKTAKLLRWGIARDREVGLKPSSKRSVYRNYNQLNEAERSRIVARLRRLKGLENEG